MRRKLRFIEFNLFSFFPTPKGQGSTERLLDTCVTFFATFKLPISMFVLLNFNLFDTKVIRLIRTIYLVKSKDIYWRVRFLKISTLYEKKSYLGVEFWISLFLRIKHLRRSRRPNSELSVSPIILLSVQESCASFWCWGSEDPEKYLICHWMIWTRKMQSLQDDGQTRDSKRSSSIKN